MIQSMTGYGKAESQLRGRKLICEIRSLNSKSMDLSVRMAPELRARELELRAIVNQRLERGKVDLAMYTQPLEGVQPQAFTPINWQAVNFYLDDIKNHQLPVTNDQSSIPPELMSAILRFPDVLKSQEETSELTDEEWEIVKQTLNTAIDAFIAFRTQEGAALETMFTEKLEAIAALLAEVEPYEKGRVENIKQHLIKNLDKLATETKQQVDRNRLEAELIYYLEKLDITEEKVRLTNHIRYFRETMAENCVGVGKKLGFIAQEMGREINTLGSKSNQSEMQIIVVKMKDLLEQIKEQVLNVL